MAEDLLDRTIPQHLFVGVVDGEASCTPDAEIYEIWPKFLVMVVLQGSQHFLIDDRSFRIDAGDGAAPVVMLLNVARYASLQFVNDAKSPLRKVMISAPRPWVERHLDQRSGGARPELRAFFEEHLASLQFSPERSMLQLAEQIVSPPEAMTDDFLALYRKSRGLDLMRLSCAALTERRGPAARTRCADRGQSERVRNYILENLRRPLTIEAIAQEAGASVSSVQRHFKKRFGHTVFEFIRAERLADARDSLRRNELTIAQAAYAAGYAAPAQFTTAFKRAYGVPPKEMRR